MRSARRLPSRCSSPLRSRACAGEAELSTGRSVAAALKMRDGETVIGAVLSVPSFSVSHSLLAAALAKVGQRKRSHCKCWRWIPPSARRDSLPPSGFRLRWPNLSRSLGPQLACRRSGRTERSWSPLQSLYYDWRMRGELHSNHVSSNRSLCFREMEFCA